MDDQDRPHFLELLRVLSAVDGWRARIDPTASRTEPQRGSPLGADDKALDPYHLSHATWHSLGHAVDHLHCLRSLLQEARMIHMYAPYSLVRAALENACAAVWMLQPKRRADRIERRLRFAMTDIRSGEETKRLIGQTGPRSEQERIDQVRDIAARAGVAESVLKRRAAYSEIVKDAGSIGGADSAALVVCWKMCSGMTHGDYWSTFSSAQRTELPGAPPGLGAFKIEANVRTLMYVTTLATQMTALGWQLYDQRSRSPF